MGMKFNKKAYGLLTDDEKSSLSLQQLHGKSTWQAGEVLNRSHYKYLEISTRAKKFFELFTQHYNLYVTLIPQGLPLNENFATYLNLTIERRLKVKDAVAEMPSEWRIAKTRDGIIETAVNDLKKSKSLNAQNLYNILMDFDRYNNFRILPKTIQEPSGFKRRNSKRFKAHMKISVSMHPYALHRIREVFECNTKNLKNEGFVMLACHPHEKTIIRINNSPENIQRLSRLSIYIFQSEQKCQEYLDLVFEYLDNTRNPAKGQLFWPKFRNLIKESLNFDEINSIAPNRKAMHDALFDMDILVRQKSNKQKFNDSFRNS